VLSSGPVPLLEVEVSETSVSFERSYPPAALAGWHSELLGAEPAAAYAQREEGRFVTPGLWIDSWEVDLGDGATPATFRFTHAVTPVDRASTRHVWRVSRNFTPGAEASTKVAPLFAEYYARVRGILETMQGVLSLDGPRPDVSVAADAAALQVRKIVHRMVADEHLGGKR
jgi:vanillate O-demethylase monooxygenase subunit